MELKVALGVIRCDKGTDNVERRLKSKYDSFHKESSEMSSVLELNNKTKKYLQT